MPLQLSSEVNVFLCQTIHLHVVSVLMKAMFPKTVQNRYQDYSESLLLSYAANMPELFQLLQQPLLLLQQTASNNYFFHSIIISVLNKALKVLFFFILLRCLYPPSAYSFCVWVYQHVYTHKSESAIAFLSPLLIKLVLK